MEGVMPLWYSKKHSMKTVEIKNEKIYLDGEVIFQMEDSSFVPFIKAAYKNLGFKYSKFHKMDRLCKLAFVAANYLLGENGLEGYQPEEIGMVMANKSSTLYTDSKHCDAIRDREDYYPSPAVFVYTLPNIMIGEIAIRYKIKGESVFFVSDDPNTEMLQEYAQDMIQNGLASVCLAGWVDYTEEEYYAILYLIK